MSNTYHQEREEMTKKESLFEFLSQKRVMSAITILPALLLFSFITLLPMLWAIAAGFHDIGLAPGWEWVGLENYVWILQDASFWDSVWKAIIFAGGSVAFQVVTGTILALLLNRSFKYAKLVRAICFVPYLIPTAILGFVALWMGNSQYGIINQILFGLGLIDEFVPWYGDPDLAMISVILTSSWKFTLFVTIMVLARLQSIPEGYFEAARVSGATAYQVFRDITLPNLKGVLFIVILLRGVWMFNKFDIIWVLTSGGPADATTTAPIYAYEVAFRTARLGTGAAVASLLFFGLAVAAVIYFTVFSPSDEVRVE